MLLVTRSRSESNPLWVVSNGDTTVRSRAHRAPGARRRGRQDPARLPRQGSAFGNLAHARSGAEVRALRAERTRRHAPASREPEKGSRPRAISVKPSCSCCTAPFERRALASGSSIARAIL